MTRVLITGAAGGIGRVLRQGLGGRYDLLRLSDIAPLGEAAPGEEVVRADIRDFDATLASMAGIDCVVHLAGIPVEDRWEKLLPINIDGTHNVFEAAHRAGVRRVIFASSNHAIGYYRRERVIDDGVPPRPDTLYGVTKAFGEALGRYFADKRGLSVACLRIGSFRDRPADRRQLHSWLSHRDMVQLVRRCIEAPDFHFLIVYGASANTRNTTWDNSAAARLIGFAPEDDSEAYAAELLATAPPENEIAAQFHGGPFCADDFRGDTKRID